MIYRALTKTVFGLRISQWMIIVGLSILLALRIYGAFT